MTPNATESPVNHIAATPIVEVTATAPTNETPQALGTEPDAQSAHPPRQTHNERRHRKRQGGEREAQPNSQVHRGAAPARQHPMLDQLAALYPALFGERLLPLKRGIFQDLLAAQPEALDKDGLKAALALHTRSTRYLTAVASGGPRHNLAAKPVEPLAPEHVHHALIEVFRRRGARSREDLRPKMRQRIAIAFEASGLSRDAYLELVSSKDEEVNQITRDGVEVAASQLARDEALLLTFEASGKSLNEFADMYGLHVLEANRTLERAKVRRHQLSVLVEANAKSEQPAPTASPDA